MLLSPTQVIAAAAVASVGLVAAQQVWRDNRTMQGEEGLGAERKGWRAEGASSGSQEPSLAHDADDSSPWTDAFVDKITTFASPLTDLFGKHDEEEEASQSESEWPIARKVATFASPVADPPSGRLPEEAKEETVAQPVSSWTKKLFHNIPPMVSSFKVRSSVTLDALNVNDLSREMQAVAVLVLFLLVLVLRRFFLRRKKNTPPPPRRARTATYDAPPANRTQSGSSDRSRGGSRDRIATEEGMFQVKKGPALPISVFGPHVNCISYQTWAPPLKWSEASRQLLPQGTRVISKGKVTLHLEDGMLTSHGTSNRLNFSVFDVSIRVKHPTAGGVLQLYVKGTPPEEWMEHTFASAYDAAQFQHDLIAYQVVGESIRNMYEALELMQKGSMAHNGKECVLHDITADERKAAVAWDDAMRCFCGIPMIRAALEKDLLERDFVVEQEGADEPALNEDYLNKRLLLGLFDFYRLFVRKLEPTALPETDSSPIRVDEMLELRKQVASASLIVQSYVQAKTVVNKGWAMGQNLSEQTLVKRLAYDDPADNIERDSASKNEYYEGTVSRDVRCEVHSLQHLQKAGSSVLSQYQAYSLVGSQVFKLPPVGQDHPLTHSNDPVLALPSFRELVETHSDLDFFVCAFFPEGPRIAIVHVFVRSLPKGVDAAFDTAVSKRKVL